MGTAGLGLAGFAGLMRADTSFSGGNLTRQFEEQQVTSSPSAALTATERSILALPPMPDSR